MPSRPPERFRKEDQKNLLIALVLSSLLIVGWQYFVEAPKREKLTDWHQQEQKREAVMEALKQKQAEENPGSVYVARPRDERISKVRRLPLHSSALNGSISLKGLRFDDLKLARYHVLLDPNSPEVDLLSPPGGDDTYFAEIGWISADKNVAVPDSNTVWNTDADHLEPGTPVAFWWDNGQGQRFIVRLLLDKNYMFTVVQEVQNRGARPITLVPYGYINRTYDSSGLHTYILHEGPLGVLDNSLTEISYGDLKDGDPESFDEATGWLGFTDKYWLTAMIPGSSTYKANFSYYDSKGQDRYQAEYTSPPLTVAPGENAKNHTRLFAGAKVIDLLDAYAEGGKGEYNTPIPLFDRAVDFGVLYFLTKPMFLLLDAFYRVVLNFGVAIIMMTLLIKLAMFPLANKGYKATSRLRALQPQMAEIKEKHGEDRLKMQQEMMALYKREKVNPAAGCLPIIVQIPVFFALYKVLFVTIEMRHAPFIGWLKDLSAPDPSNIFTLLGLLEWHPPAYLHIGILPVFMGFTMWAQMQLQPKPTDPTQARIFKFMPFIFTIMLAKMPAGLVLYWTVSNTLSILQQWVITRKYGRLPPKHAAKDVEK